MVSKPILWILGLVFPATGIHPENLQFQLIAQTARHELILDDLGLLVARQL
jgi:hypothetical protein